jgi:hypothetical protein
MFDAKHQMRTTLRLDDDVLSAARVLARERRQSIGSVISQLLRSALTTPAPSDLAKAPQGHRNGFPLLPLQPTGGPVDLDLVNSLREDGE